MKRRYTKLLKCCTNLRTCVFPNKCKYDCKYQVTNHRCTKVLIQATKDDTLTQINNMKEFFITLARNVLRLFRGKGGYQELVVEGYFVTTTMPC